MNIYRFRIPLQKELKLQRGTLTERCGFIIEYHNNFAEISPLSEFSEETADEAYSEIIALRNILKEEFRHSEKSPDDLLSFFSGKYEIRCPSVQFALWMLAHPLNGILPKSHYHFILGTPDESLNLYRRFLDRLSSDGSTTDTDVKLKIGIHSRDRELTMIQRMTDMADAEGINVRLILDANLSQTSESVADYYHISGSHLKYIEDPCNDVAMLRRKHPDIPIAYDELFRKMMKEYVQEGKEFKPEMLNSFSSRDTLIIKPGLTGHIHEIMDEFIHSDASCQSRLPTVTLSSAFESPIGISYIEKLSAFMKFNSPGTDTLKYFPEDALSVSGFLKKYCIRIV